MGSSRNGKRSKTMTLRLNPDVVQRLDALAVATDRSKAWLAAQAIAEFLEVNEWQIRAIDSAMKKATQRRAKFVDHAKVEAWLASWGHRNEKREPRA
jgi:RHH-type transcriptional regulator, rel operon repressor / antitoxin RelB